MSVVRMVDRVLAVGEPTRAEVPTALRPRAQVTVDLLGRAAGPSRRLDVLAIGFVARRRAIVPVAIEERPVGKPDGVTGRRSGPEVRGAVHPVGVFGLELGKIPDEHGVAVVRGDEFDHE